MSAWSRRRPRLVAALSGVVALVLLGATVTFTVLHLRAYSITQARAEAKTAAERAVPALLSYDHKTLAAETASRIAMLTGTFQADYAKLMRDEVLPVAEQSALVTTSTLVGSGVDGEDGPDQVTLLMFVNQSTGSEGAAPTTAASRIRVTMQRSGDQWLVADLKPV